MNNISSNLLYIRLILPAGEALAVPPLSAILGQSQINANEFCKQFNVRSSFYSEGTLLSVSLFRNSNNSFFFSINKIFLPFLLYQVVEEGTFNITIEKLYDVFLIYKRFYSTNCSEFSLAVQLFGSIRASKFRIL